MAIFMVDCYNKGSGVYVVGNTVELPTGFSISKKARRVMAYALCGGNAAQDGKMRIKYNGKSIVDVNNQNTDDVPDKDDLLYISTNYVLGPYQPLEIEVMDVLPSVGYMVLITKDLTRRGRR